MTSRSAARSQARARQNPAVAGPVVRQTPSGADVRAGYAKRLDDLVEKMADAFKVSLHPLRLCVRVVYSPDPF